MNNLQLHSTFHIFTTGHFYGRANLLAFLAQDAVCAVGLGNKLRHLEPARLAKSVR